MKKNLFSTLLFFLLTSALTLQAQTARKFTINLTDDGAANMVVFLPEKPAGRAVVGIPGGGYSMLSKGFLRLSPKKRWILNRLSVYLRLTIDLSEA